MLRILFIFLICLSAGFSCVKPALKEEIPVAEYKDFEVFNTSDGEGDAILTIGYEDGDGDLFIKDVQNEGPNVVFSIYIYDETTKKFKVFIKPNTIPGVNIVDSSFISVSVKEPADGYYKGKSIKGDIKLPLNQFRPNPEAKIFYYRGYLMDTDWNMSNIVTTPTFTVDF
ncbi:MAG: hypothetical protein JNL60_06800 [Bacteroidia bacterium]|nr:hypothetical protein [Bacteroidia bacterium]